MDSNSNKRSCSSVVMSLTEILPSEVLETILSKATTSVVDFLSLCRVCKTWMHLLASSTVIQQQLVQQQQPWLVIATTNGSGNGIRGGIPIMAFDPSRNKWFRSGAKPVSSVKVSGGAAGSAIVCQYRKHIMEAFRFTLLAPPARNSSWIRPPPMPMASSSSSFNEKSCGARKRPLLFFCNNSGKLVVLDLTSNIVRVLSTRGSAAWTWSDAVKFPAYMLQQRTPPSDGVIVGQKLYLVNRCAIFRFDLRTLQWDECFWVPKLRSDCMARNLHPQTELVLIDGGQRHGLLLVAGAGHLAAQPGLQLYYNYVLPNTAVGIWKVTFEEENRKSGGASCGYYNDQVGVGLQLQLQADSRSRHAVCSDVAMMPSKVFGEFAGRSTGRGLEWTCVGGQGLIYVCAKYRMAACIYDLNTKKWSMVPGLRQQEQEKENNWVWFWLRGRRSRSFACWTPGIEQLVLPL